MDKLIQLQNSWKNIKIIQPDKGAKETQWFASDTVYLAGNVLIHNIGMLLFLWKFVK